MHQASRIVAQWTGASGVIGPDRIACGAWKRAVGAKVAQRTRAIGLVRTTLVIEVEDELWKRNLWALRCQILKNLEKAIGPEIVTDIELRVMAPRLGPQRAEQVDGADVPKDEADAIADPGLRRIYKAARLRSVRGKTA